MPEKDIEIKGLGADDAASLSALASKAYTDHYADTWYDEGVWYLQTYFSVSHLAEELLDSNARFFAVCYKKKAIGFLKLNLFKPLAGEERDALELERIYLVKSAGGKGIGTHLLQFVFEIARQEKKEIIWLKVMDTSPDAVRFYKKMGFEICGVHQVDFNQKKEDMRGMYIMRKQL